MSTRAHIRITDGRDVIMLYHHHDGYPEGVGSYLLNFLKDRKYWNGEEIANDLIKDKHDEEYEVTTCLHGDEEYVYVIDCDNKTLKCYSSIWDGRIEDICIPSRQVPIP